MKRKTILFQDLASGLYQGERKSQQDAIETHFSPDTGISFLILSDGMGGGGFGNLASRMIVRTSFSTLKSHLPAMVANPQDTPAILQKTALAANRSLANFISDQPDKDGMGGTLILMAMVARRVYWLSVGDSLAYRFNKSGLTRLNADHSLASGIDKLASLGQIDPRIAKKMASRNTLTSALMGRELKVIDCPKSGMPVSKGDRFILASDGIQTLNDAVISDVFAQTRKQTAAHCVARFINEVELVGALGQDNVAVGCVTAS